MWIVIPILDMAHCVVLHIAKQFKNNVQKSNQDQTTVTRIPLRIEYLSHQLNCSNERKGCMSNINPEWVKLYYSQCGSNLSLWTVMICQLAWWKCTSMNVNCDSNAWLGTLKLGTYSWLSNKQELSLIVFPDVVLLPSKFYLSP